MKKRLVSLVAALLLLMLCAMPATASFENTHVLSGDQAADLVAVAKTQVGYNEGSLEGEIPGNDNYQKYGVWYDEAVENLGAANSAWGATFVLWCADQVGVDFGIIPNYIYIPYMQTWFKEAGLYHDVSAGEDYTPKEGDLMFITNSMSNTATQIGIVTAADDQHIYTIEGNAQPPFGECVERGAVVAKTYSYSYARIGGYATPLYCFNEGDVNGDGVINTSDARNLLMAVLTEQCDGVLMLDIDRDGTVGTSDTRSLLMQLLV